MSAHGGPDALGVPRWDFSTNANACGPAPHALEAVLGAEAGCYPDPDSTALRNVLGSFHGVDAGRIVVAASASEFITRLTAALGCRARQPRVWAPEPGYGDYRRAADAWGFARAASPADAALAWVTEPASPTGQSAPWPVVRDDAVLVVDEAYAPLRLVGEGVPPPPGAWRLVSPNKALGLTGVRAAYAIAPPGAGDLVEALRRLAPSWPVGAHGEAMLQAWTWPATQAWLGESREVLRGWRGQLLALGEALGWVQSPSVTPFHVVRWPGRDVPATLAALRTRSVKLRDTASMGLPGAVRVSVRPPDALAALHDAWREGVA